jgi:hypothetical protein
LGEAICDLTGGGGVAGPDGAHDFPFGVGDAGNGFLHGGEIEAMVGLRWITSVRVEGGLQV